MIKATVKGIPEVQRKLKSMGQRAADAMAGAIYAEGLHIMADSVPRTPLVTSRLRNSQFVTHPRAARRTYLHFGYGVVYAYRVHEGIKTQFDMLPRQAQKAFFAQLREQGGKYKVSEQGGPKFLENAVHATSGGRKARIRGTAERYFARGIGMFANPLMAKSAKEARAKAEKGNA